MHLANTKHLWISILTSLCLTGQVTAVYAGNNVRVGPPIYEEVQAHLVHLHASPE